ncbi:MAG: response regulator [Deltaproteobacteria bacterium]|nr:response regulator [Deltaproteobacteria bacterium]
MERKPKVLLIDDDEQLLKLMKIYFSNSGLVPVTACSGKKGIKLFASEKPDVVVLDIMMPEMNGIDVCRILRAKMGFRAVPIIAFTAYNKEEIKKEILEAGASLFLLKGIDMGTLVQHVKSFIPTEVPGVP